MGFKSLASAFKSFFTGNLPRSAVKNVPQINVEDYQTPDKKSIQKIYDEQSQAGKQSPTNGEWTDQISYNPERKEMDIDFKSGFHATYPGVTFKEFQTIKKGKPTKDGKRSNSVGAALHQSPHYSNYI